MNHDVTQRAADLDAIRKVVQQVEWAQQREDPDAFLRLFTTEAVWVTAFGRRLIGLDEIGEFTRSVLPGSMATSTAHYEVANVVFVRPDVALVQVDQQPITLDGLPLESEDPGRPLYVMVMNEGRWKIAAGQNTKVRQP
jgi:uncharacterized protein (TIGR02246 family)